MVRVIYKTIVAMLAAIALSSTEARLGVAYNPWGSGLPVTKDVLKTQLTLISKYFTVFRSYQTLVGSTNIIEVAAGANIQVDVGIEMNDNNNIHTEIQAVCKAHKSHRNTINAVFVGNENLLNGNFGKYDAQTLIGYINQIKACTNNEVQVGTVQRIKEWLSAPGAEAIVEASTIVGVNIHPFFSTSDMSPFDMLKTQWGQVTDKYKKDANKFMIGETGYPRAGEVSYGNHPSAAIAQEYLNQVTKWAAGVDVIWFMLCDIVKPYNQLESEKYYGLFDSTCTKPQLIIPSSPGNSTSPAPSAFVLVADQASQQTGNQVTPVPVVDQASQQTDNQVTPVPVVDQASLQTGNQVTPVPVVDRPSQQSGNQAFPVLTVDQPAQESAGNQVNPSPLANQPMQQNVNQGTPQTLVDDPLTRFPPVNSPMGTTGTGCTI